MTSEDVMLIDELSSIFDELLLPDKKGGERELELAARHSLDAVTKWMLAREAARVLAAIQKPVNTRNH